jgi:hypothetical protein
MRTIRTGHESLLDWDWCCWGDCFQHRRHSAKPEPEEVSALRASVNYRGAALMWTTIKKTMFYRGGKSEKTETRPMTKAEEKRFDAAMSRMDKAFKEMDAAFEEIDKL